MLKTIARLLLDRAHHRGYHSYHPRKPWKKGKKHRGWGHDPRDHGSYGYGPPPGYGSPYGPPPYGYHRPTSFKAMILEAILRRLFKR